MDITVLVPGNITKTGLAVVLGTRSGKDPLIFVAAKCHPNQMLKSDLTCAVCGKSYSTPIIEEASAVFSLGWEIPWKEDADSLAQTISTWVSAWLNEDREDIRVELFK